MLHLSTSQPFSSIFYLPSSNNTIINTFFLNVIMSKRPPTSHAPTDVPVAKKPRIDVDSTVVELKTQGIKLLDSLKAQKAAIQWGHTTCRDDTLACIKRAESLISSVEELETKSKEQVIVLSRTIIQEANLYCSVHSQMNKLIVALVESEINTLATALNRYNTSNCCGELPEEASILDGVQQYQRSIARDVKNHLKEKFKDLSVDEVIKTVQAETKSAYMQAAKETLADILEDVWA